MNNGRASIWIALSIALLPFLIFLPETLGRRAFYVSDFQNYFYPYRKATVDLVHAGNLPLWNPYAGGGMPLLADGQTAQFYPPNWLAYFMRPIHALMLATIAGYSIAGVGMFAFARTLKFDRMICTIGALGFMFSGYMTTQVMRPSISATIALAPWLFWALDRMLAKPTIGRCALAACIVALQLFAGHPQVPVYTGISLLAYTIVVATPRLRNGWRTALTPLGWLIATYVGGALLAAIQLLPWIEIAKLSPRAAGSSLDVFTSNSLVGADWLLFLFPLGYGSVETSWMQSIANVHFKIPPISWERMAYVGVLPLVLAIVGLFDIRRIRAGANESADDVARYQFNRLCAVLIALVPMFVIACIGDLPFAELLRAVPVLGQFRANARALGIIALLINVLAMFGLNRIASKHRRLDAISVIVASLIVAAIGSVLWLANAGIVHGYDGRTRMLWESALRWPNRNAIVPLVVAIVSLIVLLLPIRRANHKLTLLALVIAIDLGCFARVYNPTVPTTDYEGIPGAAAFLKNDPEPYRVALFPGNDFDPPARARNALKISWTLAFGIEDINSYNSLQTRRSVDYLVSTKHPDVLYGLLTSRRLHPPLDRVLIPLDVKYAILEKGYPWNPHDSWTRVYDDDFVEIRRNPHTIARAFFAEFVKPVSDPDAILKEMRGGGFDALKVALVEGEMSSDEARKLWSGVSSDDSAERIDFSANQQTWRTRTRSPRLFVLSEMYFPGWYASFRKAGTSDAWQSLPLYQTNYLFRGIPVPGGDNEIRLVYRPMSLIVGAIITCATVLAILSALIMVRRKRSGVAA